MANRFLVTIWLSSAMVGIWAFVIHDESSYDHEIDANINLTSLAVDYGLSSNMVDK